MAIKIVYQGLNGAVAIDEQQNTTVSADYDAVFSDYIITATGAGNFTVTLPPANPSNGKTVVIKCLTANPITVSAQSGEFIDSVASKILNNGEVLDLISDGVKWIDTAASAINGSKITNGTITADKLATGSVTADKLATNSVTADKIATGSVTAGKLATDSVTADKIATGAVGTSEINTSATPTVNTIYTNNWFRSNGSTGWYNESYGGGIFMEDFTYVKVYNSKAFMPSAGSGNNGIIFPFNPGGGSGDSASIKYYTENIEGGATEDTKLEIRVANDDNDRIVLNAPAGQFYVGKSYNAAASISASTLGQVEFAYASGDSRRYLKMQSDGNMVIYNPFGTTPLWASGTTGSDIKLKENIKPYAESGIQKIKKLNVVQFNYVKEYDGSGEKKIGFIAQEVEKIIPQAIKSITQNQETTLLLHKEEIVPHLVKAIQEQQTHIESLEERIKKLEELIK